MSSSTLVPAYYPGGDPTTLRAPDQSFCKGCTEDTSDVQAQIKAGIDQASTQEPLPQSVVEIGADSCGTGQTILNANTATLVKVRNSCRRAIKVTNLSAIDIYIGFSPSVDVNSGDLLLGTRGSFIVIPTTLDVYAIAATGTPTVSYMEVSQ
jgi:hypothetical protein